MHGLFPQLLVTQELLGGQSAAPKNKNHIIMHQNTYERVTVAEQVSLRVTRITHGIELKGIAAPVIGKSHLPSSVGGLVGSPAKVVEHRRVAALKQQARVLSPFLNIVNSFMVSSLYIFIFIFILFYVNINNGRADYILSGGESNPGPPKQVKISSDADKAVGTSGVASIDAPKTSAEATISKGPPAGASVNPPSGAKTSAEANKTPSGAHNGSAKSQKDCGSAPLNKGAGSSQPQTSAASLRSSPKGSNEHLHGANPNGRGKSQKGSGSAPHNKGAGVSRSISRAISVAESTHKFSKVYDAAVKQGFKTRAALDLFNVWVRANTQDISPDKVTVCMDCGEAKLTLCEHFIRAASPVEVVEDHLLIPNGKAAYKFTFSFIGKIRHMFATPKFDFTRQNNHDLGGFDNSMIGDDNIISSLYNYLKLNKDVSYRMNGVDKRDVRMAHMRKLSHRWLADIKINPTRLKTEQVNSIILTCQRVCDEAESDMLQSYLNPTRNFGQACMGFLLRNIPRAVIGGVCCAIVYKSGRSLLNAGVRTTAFSSFRLIRELVLLSRLGSKQVFRLMFQQIVSPPIVALLNFFRFSLPRYLTLMTASSCQIARTMCLSLYTNVILKTPIAGFAQLIKDYWIESSLALPVISASA